MLLKAGTYRFNDELTSAVEKSAIKGTVGGYIPEWDTTVEQSFEHLSFIEGTLTTYLVDNGAYVTSPIYENGAWLHDAWRNCVLPTDTEVDDTFGTWYISNTNYNEVNAEDTIYTEKSSWYKSVADAIRNKKGTTDPILRDDFASEIEGISGGGDTPYYDGKVIIEKAKNLVFSNVAFTIEGQAQLWSETFGTEIDTSYYKVETKPTENIESYDMENLTLGLYFVEDENDIFYHLEDGWVTLGGGLFSDMNISFKGIIGNITEATEDGYYALMTEGVSE